MESHELYLIDCTDFENFMHKEMIDYLGSWTGNGKDLVVNTTACSYNLDLEYILHLSSAHRRLKSNLHM